METGHIFQAKTLELTPAGITARRDFKQQICFLGSSFWLKKFL